MWKEFFYFNRFERRAVLLISTVLVILILLPFFWPIQDQQGPGNDPELYEAFTAYQNELNRQQAQKDNKKKWFPKPLQEHTTAAKTQKFAFDPNTVTAAEMYRLGIPERVIRNSLKYRKKGGKFQRPEDFRKIYGMTDELFSELRPYMAVTSKELQVESTDSFIKQPKSIKTFYKYPEGTIVELNRADTTELKKIPGIGQVTARRIIAYRKRLGGFYSPQQLIEIDETYARFTGWFRTDTSALRKINLNKLSVSQLMKHPYLNFYQAKVIDQYRKKRGPIQSLRDLSLYEEFSEQDLNRLRPYTTF